MKGLQKENLPINVSGGVDTKTDDKHVVPGRLTRMENARFKKINRIDKRNGYDSIDNESLSGSDLSTPDSAAIFKGELLQYNNQNLYSYSPNTGRWVDKGAFVSSVVTTDEIIDNTAEQSQVDSATNGGITVFAYEDSRGGVRASVYDQNTATLVLRDTSLDSSASRARCLSFGDFLYVFYYKSGSLYVRRLNPLDPTSFDAAVTVSNTVNTTNPTYDVLAYNNVRILWAHNVQGSAEILAGWLNDVPAVLTGTLAAVTISEAATDSLTLVRATNTFFVCYANTSDGVRCTVRNNGLAELVAPFHIENYTSTAVTNMTGYASATNTITLLYEVSDSSNTYDYYIRKNTATTAGSAGTAADFKRSVGLWTKVFTYTDTDGNESAFVGVTYESTLQPTYFIARVSDGLIVAKQLYTLGSGLTTRPILQTVNNLSTGIYAYGLLKRKEIISENGSIYLPFGVYQTKFDLTTVERFNSVEIGNNLMIAGGAMAMYDGDNITEFGFHLYPEISLAQSVSGGSLSNGTFQVIVIFKWRDNFGQIHRSAPSVAQTINLNGGGSSERIIVTIPNLRLTSKDGTNRENVSIIAYATEDGGSTFYRQTSVSSPTYNDVTADETTLSITSISTSTEILYTTGGVLEDSAPPACSVLATFKNRLFIAGLEEANQFWYSKEVRDGQPVEFNDTLVQAIDSAGGRVKAAAVLDDKLLFFKKDRYFYTFGDGPNDLGQDGNFAEPEFVTADIGAVNNNSIARYPFGLMLKTLKGIYSIDSSLSPVYIGADVEDYNGLTVSSANYVPDTNEVRFTHQDGNTLVYDHFFRRWYVYTQHNANDAVIWDNKFTLFKTNGDILKENTSVFRDGQLSYGITIETGWIALSGVTGYQRVYRLFFLGDYKSAHVLRVKVAYDYSEAYTSTYYFDPTSSLNPEVYGGNATYGAGTYYGGVNSAYRFMMALKQQKCQAVRFLIEEITTTATAGTQEGLNINDIGLLIGRKRGMAKLRTAQTGGDSY